MKSRGSHKVLNMFHYGRFFFKEYMGEIEEKSIGFDKVQEILGEKTCNNEIRDIGWRMYTYTTIKNIS